MATSPIILPAEVITILTPQQFEDRYNVIFAENEFERIRESTFRTFKADLLNTFANWNQISANHLRGGTHLKNTLAERDGIQLRRRIIGMSCVVANPATAADRAAGIVRESATFQLIRSGGVAYAAYPDLVATETVNARWIQTSGSFDERVKSYPEFKPEDFIYRAGDAIQYTFPAGHAQAGVSGLYEARHDMADDFNPVPTGLPTDPNWKPFAPLVGPGYLGFQLTTVPDARQLSLVRQVSPNRLYRLQRYTISTSGGLGTINRAEFDVLFWGLTATAYTPDAYKVHNTTGAITKGTYNLTTDTFTVATSGPANPDPDPNTGTGPSSIVARLYFTYSGPGHVVELPPNTTEVLFVNNESGRGIHDEYLVLDLDATPQTLTVLGGAMVEDACYGRILIGTTGPEPDPTGFWDTARKWSATAKWTTQPA